MNIVGNVASTVDALLERLDKALDFVFFPKEPQTASTDIEINGVVLPKLVADQLRMQGIALSNYSPAELQAAVRACAFDSKLIDDEHGVNFFDRLELTERERKHQQRATQEAMTGLSFRERILKEREAKSHAAEEGAAPSLHGCCT